MKKDGNSPARQEQGVTLLELLIVVGILALLSALASIGVTGTSERARGVARDRDIEEVQKQVDRFTTEHKLTTYPTFRGGLLPPQGSFYAINWDAPFITLSQPTIAKTFVPDIVRKEPKHARQVVNPATRRFYLAGTWGPPSLVPNIDDIAVWRLDFVGRVDVQLRPDEY